jgi:hypothetical protein
MKNMNKEEIKKILKYNPEKLKDVKEKYWKIKQILEIAMDYGRQDQLALDIRIGLDTHTASELQQFVEECEDVGVHRLTRSN